MFIPHPVAQSSHVSPPQVDWEAFEQLQLMRENEANSFNLNCLDDALDRLLSNPCRSAEGAKLAQNVFHDAKRSSRVQRQQSKELVDAELIPDHRPYPRTDLENREQFSLAKEKISLSWHTLKERYRKILALKAQNASKFVVESELGVKCRQFRNLTMQARRALFAIPGIPEALQTLLECSSLDGTNIDEFLWKLTEEDKVAA